MSGIGKFTLNYYFLMPDSIVIFQLRLKKIFQFLLATLSILRDKNFALCRAKTFVSCFKI